MIRHTMKYTYKISKREMRQALNEILENDSSKFFALDAFGQDMYKQGVHKGLTIGVATLISCKVIGSMIDNRANEKMEEEKRKQKINEKFKW